VLDWYCSGTGFERAETPDRPRPGTSPAALWQSACFSPTLAGNASKTGARGKRMRGSYPDARVGVS